MKKSLYGTRDAALNWTTAYTSVLVQKMGLVQGKATPCAFFSEKLQVRTVVHGDDFVSEGPEEGLRAMDTMLRKEFEIKTEILGPDPRKHVQSIKILNRIITWGKDGISWEPDPRHAELIVESLGTQKNAATAGIDDIEEDDTPLSAEATSSYRSLAARANYLAIDRPDILFATKELCRSMSRPTAQAWAKLERLGKYLRGKPRLVWHYHWQEEAEFLRAFSDANWAGCPRSRRSTSGGVIMMGTHVIRVYSKTQSVIALSSAESEFYATTKSATESIGMVALLKDFGMTKTIVMEVDASAALGVIERKGIGRIRHLQTGALWL